MASNSSIQQHEPLRIPSNWGKEEKRFVAQLEEVLDDLFRRFNRLRMEDLGAALRKTIVSASDDASTAKSTVEQTAEKFEAKFDSIGANGVDTQTGITSITQGGVKVEHSEIGGHTELNADGMRMYDAAGNLVGGMYKSGNEVKTAVSTLANPKHGEFEVTVAPSSFEGEQVGIAFRLGSETVGAIDAYNNGDTKGLLLGNVLEIRSNSDIRFQFYAKNPFTGQNETMYLTASEIWHAVSMVLS